MGILRYLLQDDAGDRSVVPHLHLLGLVLHEDVVASRDEHILDHAGSNTASPPHASSPWYQLLLLLYRGVLSSSRSSSSVDLKKSGAIFVFGLVTLDNGEEILPRFDDNL